MAQTVLDTRIGLNASEYISAAQTHIVAMGGQADAIDSLISVSERFNAKGKVTGATVKALTKDFRELTIELGKANKTFKGPTITQDKGPDLRIKEVTTRETRDQAAQRLLAADNFPIAQAGVERVRSAFPAPPNSTLSQLSRYENQLQRIQKLLIQGKITGERFNEIFNSVQTGKGLSNLKLSGDEQKLVGLLSSISKGLNTAREDGEKFGIGLRGAFRITEAVILKDIIGSVASGLKDAAVEAGNFQIKISQIRTLSTENQSSFEAWSKSIQKVSNQLGIPQTEVAIAAYEALSAQVVNSREETEQFILAAGRLARVGVSDIKTSGDLLSAIFNSFNITANRSDEIIAKVFTAVDRGSFTVQQLGQNFGRTATTANALNVSLEEQLAALTTLTRQGVDASDAQTQLSNVYLKLTKPTENTTRLLNSLGFETGQAAIQALGFVGILEQIEDAANGDVKVLSEFGGELRAIRGLIGLTTRGKGSEFNTDLQAIRDSSANQFAQAELIRGESAGDQLTKEFTKVKNFFVDDFGQSLINSFNTLSNRLGGVFNIVEKGTKVIFTLGIATLGYIGITRLGTVTTTAATLAQRLFGLSVADTTVQLTRGQRAALLFQSTVSGIAKVATFGFILNEVAKYKREIDDVNKKTEDFENTLKRIQAAREGKTVTGENQLEKLFQASALKESSDFSQQVDNVFKVLLQAEAQASVAVRRQLTNLQEEGKETATQLSVGFKTALDSIQKTVTTYSQGIQKANSEIEKSKKSILGIKETVEGLIFDLKFDFASSAQKFVLRDQEIQRLTQEATKLLQSNDEEDLAKGRQLSSQVLSKIKEDARERVQAQVDADIEARRQRVFSTGQADNSPIFAFTNEQEQRLRNFADFFSNLEQQVIDRKQKEIKATEQILGSEKERQKLLVERIKAFEALRLVDADGGINPQFKTTDNKFNATKFQDQFDTSVNNITSLLKTEEEKAAVVVAFEKQKVNLLKQQSAQIELQKINLKQLELGKTSTNLKKEFEAEANKRIKASADVTKASSDLGVSGDFIKTFINQANADTKFSTAAQDEGAIVRFGAQLTQVLFDGVNKLGRKQISVSEAGDIALANKGLIEKVASLTDTFNSLTKQATRRDDKGNLLGDQKDIDKLRSLNTNIALELNLLLSKFTGQLNNDAFATPNGITLEERSTQTKSAIDALENALNAEKVAKNNQEFIISKLSPEIAAAQQATNATVNLTSTIQLNTQAMTLLTNSLRTIPVPSNIPEINPFAGGFHDGGMINGPKGYDNLLIRAEAGEFVVNQIATRKWLPQLVAMNKGMAPKIAGHYHEGGLVQTNVGDVNVTISGPASPERTVKQIGQAIRRQVQRGNLNLNKRG